MSKLVFRLEFNEAMQNFHHCYDLTDQENTHGWKTIAKDCTEQEGKVFDAMFRRYESRDVSSAFVIALFRTCRVFIQDLKDSNLHIGYLSAVNPITPAQNKPLQD